MPLYRIIIGYNPYFQTENGWIWDILSWQTNKTMQRKSVPKTAANGNVVICKYIYFPAKICNIASPHTTLPLPVALLSFKGLLCLGNVSNNFRDLHRQMWCSSIALRRSSWHRVVSNFLISVYPESWRINTFHTSGTCIRLLLLSSYELHVSSYTPKSVFRQRSLSLWKDGHTSVFCESVQI